MPAKRTRTTVGPPAKRRARLPRTPRPVVDHLTAFVRAQGTEMGERSAKRLDRAARAFRAERFAEACSLLVPLARAAPDIAEVRELYGLTLYRLERYQRALRELEAFRRLSGTTEQNPVLADCYRALGCWADVEALWKELGDVSPSAELVTEGLIVTAGARADRGDLESAIRMLERGWTAPASGTGSQAARRAHRDGQARTRGSRPRADDNPKRRSVQHRWRLPRRPRPHHLRRAYALADLYERAGRAPRARELFSWVARHDPGLADVIKRAGGLS